jgi:hypothetical protein
MSSSSESSVAVHSSSASSPFEELEAIDQTQCNISEDSILHLHRYEPQIRHRVGLRWELSFINFRANYSLTLLQICI